MSRMLPLLFLATLPLSACAPATNTPVAAAAVPAEASPPANPVPAGPAPAETSTPGQAAPASPAEAAGASIAGAIRDGNRPPPALRVCAQPVGGGSPTCIDTAAGAQDYRIAVAPGRYYLLGWVRGGELALLAHAEQIRCIRAPCPPDTLIEVAVAAGEQREGADLSAAYLDVPAGWPARPG